jgi:5-phospho-D-xylono-1,4-lactonase
MGKIQTVLGEIAAEDLGVTYCHDHLYFMPPEPYASQDTDLRLDSEEAAINELKSFKLAGGNALVEMTTPEMGRDPQKMKTISQATGVHVIAATGYNKGKFCEPFIQDKSVDDLVEEELQDLMVGMDGTDIRAGLIKASSGLNEISAAEHKLFEAAALAHQETGAPVSTHTEKGSMALEQISLLTNGGVSPEHIVIGHSDLNMDWDTFLAVADTGVMIGFDQIAKEKYAPDTVRIDFIKRLIAAGHSRQIMLSMDLARRSNWPSFGFGYGPGLTFGLWRFVPWMLQSGVSREAVDDMLVHNPARAFAWGNPS